MSKIYPLWCNVVLICMTTMFCMSSSAWSQSMTCFSGLQASLDDSCRVVIDARTMSPGVPLPLTNYHLIIEAKDGSTLDGVHYDSSGIFIKGNIGSIIQFTEPGNFKVSVKNLSTGVACWGDLSVENKLPPSLIGDCMCSDTATVVTPECTFTCDDIDDFLSDTAFVSGLNPQYLDNCGKTANIMAEDVITSDTICGGYIVTRTWKTRLQTSLGEVIKTIGCRQKFKFDPINNSDILPPKSRAIVECGIETDPESLRNYFSDTTYFNNPDIDSAILCSYPYVVIDAMNRYDSTLITVQVERDSVSAEMVELSDGVWTLLNVLHHYTVDTSYYIKSKLPRFRPLSPSKTGTEQYCKVFARYSDTEKITTRSGCTSSYKFVRTWKLVNWCDGQAWTNTQIIAVMDNEVPKFEAPDTIPMVSTDPWICGARVSIPNPIDARASDNCTATDNLTWSAVVALSMSDIVTADASNNYTLDGLQSGSYDVIYLLSDLCGNIARDTSHLMIKDGADPIVITKDKIIVSLTPIADNCSAKIYPYNIDVGSYDACDDSLFYEIRRLNDSLWYPFVQFSQHDIMGIDVDGVAYGEHMLELRVRDRQGNSSIGWSTVRVEDKISEVEIMCGQDSVFLDCSSNLDSALLDTLYLPRAMLRSCSTSDLDINYSIISNTINRNCNVGMANVAYFIDGQSDTICIKHFSLRDLDTLKFMFPVQDTTVDCHVTDFGDLVVEGDGCNLLAQTLEEQEFEIPNGKQICKKIIRTFTTIDWCLYRANQSGDKGIYVFRQVIKIRDTEKPVITCDSQTFSAGQNCGLSGFTVEAQGSDGGCSSNLTWTARIDFDGDDIFDLQLQPWIADDGTASVTIDTLIPTGTYSILWRATDDCSNFSESLCEFTIVDNNAPISQCIGGISTTVMNTNGEATIWAVDFDLTGKSTDECGGSILYSFSGSDPNVTQMNFNCDSIPNGVSVTKELKVWIWDAAGNRDFCIVNVRLDDNAQVCPDLDEGMALISGSITTSMGDDLESAQVLVSDLARSYESFTTTDIGGDYRFNNNPKNIDYQLTAYKTDHAANGVSTLDLVLIQQYILSLRSFDDPYQVIAADVTGDQRVSAIDLVDLRRVILGITDQFVSGQSWIILDSEQSFTSIDNPWPLAQSIEINALTQNDRDNHFKAIKLGDINGNAIANSLLAGTRNINMISLVADDQHMYEGVETFVNFSPKVEDQIFGLQVSFNLAGIHVYSVAINGKTLPPHHYVISEDMLMISEVYPLGINQLDLTIYLTPDHNMMTSDAIVISESNELRSEIYILETLQTAELSLDYNLVSDVVEQYDFELYQNEPNPFNGTTTIGFFLPESSQVELSVFDMTGRQLYYENGSFDSGQNSIILNESNLQSTGMLYYQLSAGDLVATKRMIILN